MKGKHSQSVNARLRQQLDEANDARRRLEHRVRDAERARDEATSRMQDALDNGHPELREAVARERARERKLLEMAHESERMIDNLRHRMRIPMRYLIKNSGEPGAYMSADFWALLHELFGQEFYQWLNVATDGQWDAARASRREDAAMSVDDAYRLWSGWAAKYGRYRGLAAVQQAKKRRESREASAVA